MSHWTHSSVGRGEGGGCTAGNLPSPRGNTKGVCPNRHAPTHLPTPLLTLPDPYPDSSPPLPTRHRYIQDVDGWMDGWKDGYQEWQMDDTPRCYLSVLPHRIAGSGGMSQQLANPKRDVPYFKHCNLLNSCWLYIYSCNFCIVYYIARN